MPVFGPPQIMFVRGKGTELWDSDGKRYLDFLGGLAVIGLGHANPVVAEAIGDAGAASCCHVSNLFANPVATRAAMEIDRLLAEVTGQLGQVFFTQLRRRGQRVPRSSWPASTADVAATSS